MPEKIVKPKNGQEAIDAIDRGEVVEMATRDVMRFFRWLASIRKTTRIDVSTNGARTTLRQSCIP